MSEGTGRAGYIYDTSTEEERERLRSLEEANDPMTIEHLEIIGVGPGWRCLEIGGGGGSIARWLAERVAPDGTVLATDLDTRFLEEIGAPNLEVRTHNIVTEELEEEAFDLVHSRFVLEHLAEADMVMEKMVRYLKPGGWLVAEDVDMMYPLATDPTARFALNEDSASTAADLAATMKKMTEPRGIDAEYGRWLPKRMHGLGLEEIGASGRFDLMWGGSEKAIVARLSVERITKIAVDAGLLSEDERQKNLRILSDPKEAFYSPARVTAWGRKRV